MWRMHWGSAWPPGAVSGGAALGTPKAPPAAWGGPPAPAPRLVRHPLSPLRVPVLPHPLTQPCTPVHALAHPPVHALAHPCTLTRPARSRTASHTRARSRTPVHAVAPPARSRPAPRAVARTLQGLAPSTCSCASLVLSPSSARSARRRTLRTALHTLHAPNPALLAPARSRTLHAFPHPSHAFTQPHVAVRAPGGAVHVCGPRPPLTGGPASATVCLGRVRPGMLRGAEH